MSKRKITNSEPATGNKLERYVDEPFSLCFSRQLENGYEIKNLKASDVKEFHALYSRMVGQTLTNVDNLYLRDSYSDDVVDEEHILHYGIASSKFRIHGYYVGSYFHVIRIDPSHKFST